MNIIFRVLLAIYAFCLTIISLLVMMVVIWTPLFYAMDNYVRYILFNSRTAPILLFLIAFVFFALSITFLLSGVRSNKDKKAVSKHTNIGEIKISLDTVENLSLAASRRLNGVKDSKAYVLKHEDSVSVIIKVVVLPDINIPLLSEDLQVKVKRSVEDSSGIKVSDVKVLVDNIYTGYKSRVE
jgi:uncharacterized alkaline shock family protein YloU